MLYHIVIMEAMFRLNVTFFSMMVNCFFSGVGIRPEF